MTCARRVLKLIDDSLKVRSRIETRFLPCGKWVIGSSSALSHDRRPHAAAVHIRRWPSQHLGRWVCAGDSFSDHGGRRYIRPDLRADPSPGTDGLKTLGKVRPVDELPDGVSTRYLPKPKHCAHRSWLRGAVPAVLLPSTKELNRQWCNTRRTKFP